MLRTHTCGELRASHAGQAVTLCGWAHSVRDHGGLVFITLRDRYGFTQVVVEPGASQSAAECARGIHRESVLRVRGTVSHRPEGTWNNAIATGEVEVTASDIEIGDAAPICP